MIALLFVTMLAFTIIGSEMLARKLIPVTKQTVWDCVTVKNQAIGEEGIPGSVCNEQWAEAPLIEYRFNACGFRDDKPCGGPPADVYRVGLVGSSFVLGSRVLQRESFASLLPGLLSSYAGRNVDVFNMGMHGRGGRLTGVVNRFDQIRKQRPNLILWVLTPYDIKTEWDDVEQRSAPARPTPGQPAPGVGERAQAELSVYAAKSRLALLIRHLAYQSRYLYLHASLPQDEFAFLRAQPDSRWQQRLVHMDAMITQFAQASAAAGIPLAITIMPSRAQAAMASMADWPEGYDPYMIDRRVAQIAAQDHVMFIDLLPAFSQVPHPERGYLPVDGHPGPASHRLFAQVVAPALASRIRAGFPAATAQ